MGHGAQGLGAVGSWRGRNALHAVPGQGVGQSAGGSAGEFSSYVQDLAYTRTQPHQETRLNTADTHKGKSRFSKPMVLMAKEWGKLGASVVMCGPASETDCVKQEAKGKAAGRGAGDDPLLDPDTHTDVFR